MSDPRFARLCQDRRSQADAADALLGDGLKTLLADLYPDQAHFLYELLQNAEDARASNVEFILESDRLLFNHDGQDLFTYDDVEAITTIKSTKKSDDTKIGKFGVGFKAVFSYTARPEVRSGQFNFAIEDLFVPVPLSGQSRAGQTEFVIPFDNPDKPAATAFSEIAQGLSAMEATTLLFLRGIRSIQFLIQDGRWGELSRDEHEYPYVSVQRSENDSVAVSHWLRLIGGSELSPSIPSEQYVSAAFRIEAAPEPVKKGARTRSTSVVPVEHGAVCVYFPAEKQVSGLKFHVHAPFEPTPARDSVRNTPENAGLVEAIGVLVANHLSDLQKDGWLSDGLLAALPNDQDPVGELFASVTSAVRQAFWDKPITPRNAGGPRRAADLVESPPEFRRLLDSNDLAVLTSLHDGTYPEEPRWVAERSGRAGALLRGLGVARFGWDELEDVLDGASGWSFARGLDLTSLQTLTHWLESMDTSHLASFYELLGQGIEEEHIDTWRLESGDVPLLRVIGEGGVSHPSPPRGYLPVNAEDQAPGRVPTALSYFESDRPSRRKSRLEAFYHALGVRRWDARALIDARLERYLAMDSEEQPELTIAEHFEDLRTFVAHLETQPQDLPSVRERIFLLGDVDGDLQWMRPSKLFLDTPIENTGIRHLYRGLLPLASIYLGKVPAIGQFAKDLGVVHSFAIRTHDVWSNPERREEWFPPGTRRSSQGQKSDWDLPEAVSILRSGDPVLLRSLWQLAVDSPKSKAWATFQLNGSAQVHQLPSRLAQRLRGKPWVLDAAGDLRTAESMAAEELPRGWPEPPRGSLAMELGFGSDAQSHAREQQEKVRMARELGLPPQLIPLLEGRDPDDAVYADIEALLRRRQLPDAVSDNPDFRAAVVADDADLAAEYETEMRERSVVLGRQELREQTRQYLRAQYMGDEGVMYCQLCVRPMPFRVRGEWYFETVQCVPKRVRQHHQNGLALCPLCAALYRHARATSDEELLERMLSLEVRPNAGHVLVPVNLNDQERQVRFTGIHFLDLRTVLAVAGDELIGAHGVVAPS